MLYRLAQHRDAKLRHRTGRIRDDFTLAEFGDRDVHRLIQRFRLDLDGMVQTLLVQIRDAATRDTRGVIIYRAYSPFVPYSVRAASRC
jgi:hypothetical protein